MEGRLIFLGDRLRKLEVTFVEEFSGLDIVLEIHLARDACKVSGTTHKWMFAVPVELGTISGIPGGELIRCTESTACRAIGQTTNEGFRAALLVGPVHWVVSDLQRVGVPTADEAPRHFERGIVGTREVGAFGSADVYAYPRELCVTRRPRRGGGH